MANKHYKFRGAYTLRQLERRDKKEDYMQRIKEEICRDFIRSQNVNKFSVEFHEESIDEYETHEDIEQCQRKDGLYIFRGSFISKCGLYQLSKKYSRNLIADIEFEEVKKDG